MFNNWYVEEKMLQVRHDELLRASELRRMAKMGDLEKHPPAYERTLLKLGDNLVKVGFWLQDRYGERLDFRSFEFDDPV